MVVWAKTTIGRLREVNWRQRWFYVAAEAAIICCSIYWWKHLPAPGWAVAVLAFGAALMTLRERMSEKEKAIWIVLLGVLLVIELRTISKERADQTEKVAKIVSGINTNLGKSDVLIDLSKQNLAISDSLLAAVQLLGRQPSPSKDKKPIITAWGTVSQLNSKAVDGATATPSSPPQIQQGKRLVSAEALGLALRDKEHSAATIINDGTNEAGSFAKQLEIGLRDAGWQAGGDNIKIGDPEFFPDSLTLEVSASPASTEDHSLQEAKELAEYLRNIGIEANIRKTDLHFPPNFMRIKVAGR
jgi:hypothetical protein